MSKKESEHSFPLQNGFSEEKLFTPGWHIKVLSVIYGLLILSYILLKFFLD